MERLWGRLADLFAARDAHTLATTVVLAPRRLEPRRMLDAGAAGIVVQLLDDGQFVQTAPVQAAPSTTITNQPPLSDAASERTLPGEPQAVMMNTAPSNVQLAPIADINENGVVNLQLTFDDPDVGDSHTVEVEWGDGTPLETFSVASGSQFFGTTHQYLDDNPTTTSSDPYTINVRVKDAAGDFADGSTGVIVHNVAPTAFVVQPPDILENGIGSLLVVWNDPGTQDSHTVEINWGDGSVVQMVAVPAGQQFVTATHQYLDDNPTVTPFDTYAIKVKVHDDDSGVSAEVPTSIKVTNLAPSNVQIAPVASIDENQLATLNLTFDDPGSLDTHTVEVDWGDGSAVETLSVPAGARFLSTTHQYLDDNPTNTTSDVYTISLKVKDDDSGVSDVATTTVTVNNVAPSNLVLMPQLSINENGVATLNGTFNDPGIKDTHTVEIDWGDGSAIETVNLTAGTLAFTATHQYLDDNPTNTSSDNYTIKVKVADDDKGEVSGQTSVTVKNVAPSNLVLVPPGTIDENGVATLGGSFDDPGTLDSHTVEIDWGDGSPLETINLAAGTLAFSTTHQYLDDNPTTTTSDHYTISVKVKDDDTGEVSGQTLVTVNNVAPSNVQITPMATINENQLGSLSLTFDDPGTKDVHHVEVDWGDGSAVETLAVGPGARSFFATHQYLDDNPTVTTQDNYTVKVRVLDDDSGASSVVMSMITVKNVDPSNVVIAPLGTINENDVATLNLSFVDPGTQDTHTVEVDWGDGSAVETLSVVAGARVFSTTHQYLDDNPTVTTQDNYTVKVRVLDDDSGASSPPATAVITVKNVAPSNVAVIPATNSVNEGSPISLDFTFDDPGSQDTHTYQIDWGDGKFSAGTAVGHGFSATHTYADNGNYTVKATVTDDDGGIGVGMGTVAVSNVAPTLNVASNQSVNEGSLLSITDIGSITDPGFRNLDNTQDPTNGGETDETFTYEIDWGDGTAHSTGGATIDQIGSAGVLTNSTFDGSHTYADNGVYTVKVTVTDDDTGSVSKTFMVTVNNVAPTLNVAANHTVNEGSVLSITDIGTFTDPGFQNLSNTQDPTNGGETDETFTYEVDWGDGTAHSAGAATIDQIGAVGVLTKGSFDGSHT